MARKVVKSETKVSEKAESAAKWQATPEAKGKATQFRVIAFILWLVAIGIEAFTIFWLLKHTELNNFMVWLIAAIVVIGIFAVVGSQLWKKATRYDPPSEANKVTFFLKTQLGAIMTMIAFIPLIVLILINKDMSKNQKTIAGIVAVVVCAISTAFSIDWAPPSQEKMDSQTAIAKAYTGTDVVYWVKGGSVYHLCAYTDASGKAADDGTLIGAFRQGSSDIQEGSVTQAVQDGKTRLSMYGFSECGYTEGKPAFPQYLPSTDTSEEPSDSPS